MSRFACLPDDEAADWKAPKSKTKSAGKKVPEKATDNKPKDKAKIKAQQEAKALQNIAFGGQKKAKNKKKGKGGEAAASPSISSSHEPSPAPAPAAAPSLPEDWVRQDCRAVEDSFSQAMQQAILLSQLEAEEKAATDQARWELLARPELLTAADLAELSKEERRKAVKAEKKNRTMSLEQFQESKEQEETEEVEEVTAGPAVYKHPRFRDRAPGEKLLVGGKPGGPPGAAKTDAPGLAGPPGNFFSQMEEAAVVALTREQMRESFLLQEAAGSESALVANYREKLLDREGELAAARAEAAELREKLAGAKTRTKKLTEILMQAEMREKTEVLVQVHKLETVSVTSSLLP